MIELLMKSGAVGWVILANSLLAAVIFLEKLFHLHRAEIRRDDFLSGIFNIVRNGNVPEAIGMCDNTPGPVAYITRAALLHREESHAELTHAVEQAALEEIPRLERHLKGLLTAAQISPMLGLLGTVLGLISTLIMLERNAPLIQIGDAAGGMWQALITSAAGLIVAIPAFAGYNLLTARIERLVLDMERAASDIVHFLIHPDVKDAQ
jgi:biopolymer transport protein ExbB